MRRRVQELVRTGNCVSTPQGVFVPRAAVTTPAYTAIQTARDLSDGQVIEMGGQVMLDGAIQAG